MDDFLHNLRSGKLKQTERGRRDYQDYKGPQRRASNDRRRPDYYTKVTNENFALIKETLDVLAENQKRIADVMMERKEAEIRIAEALESITTLLGRQMGIDGVSSREESSEAETRAMESEGDAYPGESGSTRPETQSDGGRFDTEDKPQIGKIIATMREEGNSWEKIARYFDEQNIPTISGKGKWRGPAVKKFWDANA